MWKPGQPNGGDLQECTVYSTEDAKYSDIECSVKTCYVCVWKKEPLFSLRGLCFDTEIDHQYVLIPQHKYDGNMFFFGFGNSNIIFSNEMRSWLIVANTAEDLLNSGVNTKSLHILGIMQLEKHSNNIVPIGTHFWNLTDRCDRIMALKLTHVSNYQMIQNKV